MEFKNEEFLRISFINLFAKEIIISLIKEQEAKENIEVEKIRKRFLGENIAEEDFEKQGFQKAVGTLPSLPQEYIQETSEEKLGTLKRVSTMHRENVPVWIQSPPFGEPEMIKLGPSPEPPKPVALPVQAPVPVSAPEEIKKHIKHRIPRRMDEEEMIKITGPESIRGKMGSDAVFSDESLASRMKPHLEKIEPNKRVNPFMKKIMQSAPIGFSSMSPMEKLTPLLRDNTIIMIECPGPGKNIIVKKYNQINSTRVVLSELEIKSVIDYYSREAKIPLAGGILKAAVGNSVISAVVSEFVGARFVINKITPYSMISQ